MASLDDRRMAQRVLPRNKLDARDRKVASKSEVAGQLRQRLNLRGHDYALPLDALGATAAPAPIVRGLAQGFPLDLVFAKALAQILGRLVVRPAAPEDENASKTAPQHGRVFFAVRALQLRGRLDAGDDPEPVLSSLRQRVFERRQFLEAVELVDHHPEP